MYDVSYIMLNVYLLWYVKHCKTYTYQMDSTNPCFGIAGFGDLPWGIQHQLSIQVLQVCAVDDGHLFHDSPCLVARLEPIGSMYGILTYIWLIFMVNVGIYTIHGWYGEDVTIDLSYAKKKLFEPRKKNLITFHYNGWLIGILIMVYYNP